MMVFEIGQFVRKDILTVLGHAARVLRIDARFANNERIETNHDCHAQFPNNEETIDLTDVAT